MEKLLQQLIDRLTTLEDEFDSLPDLSIIQSMIKEVESLKQQDNLDSKFIKEQIQIFATGFFDNKSTELLSELRQSYEAIKKLNTDLIDTSKNELITKVNQDFTNLSNEFTSKYDSFKNALVKISNEYQIELDNKVNNALAEINAKLKTVKNGLDGRDGAKGDKGDKGNDGLKGLDGRDGIGITNITYRLGNLIVELSNNTTKTIKLNIPQILSGGGGGVSAVYVQDAINTALSGVVIDAYTKSETDNLISGAVDNLINGASNILDSFGEVESVLGALQTSINANSQAIDNLAYDLGTMSYTKAESDAKYQAKEDENLFIQTTAPTLATGKQALWIDNSNGNITLNLVTGD